MLSLHRYHTYWQEVRGLSLIAGQGPGGLPNLMVVGVTEILQLLIGWSWKSCTLSWGVIQLHFLWAWKSYSFWGLFWVQSLIFNWFYLCLCHLGHIFAWSIWYYNMMHILSMWECLDGGSQNSRTLRWGGPEIPVTSDACGDGGVWAHKNSAPSFSQIWYLSVPYLKITP